MNSRPADVAACMQPRDHAYDLATARRREPDEVEQVIARVRVRRNSEAELIKGQVGDEEL
jgi:hypothetical protein